MFQTQEEKKIGDPVDEDVRRIEEGEEEDSDFDEDDEEESEDEEEDEA